MTERDFLVYHGDADGIASAYMERKAHPEREYELISGRKDETDLVQRVFSGFKPVKDSRVVVLDLALDRNVEALCYLSKEAKEILYVDHHAQDSKADLPNVEYVLSDDPDKNTAILMNEGYKKQFNLWAIVGAFGDRINPEELIEEENLTEEQVETLRELGHLLNYNGFAAAVRPEDIVEAMGDNPFDFIEHPLMVEVGRNYHSDLFKAITEAYVLAETEKAAVCVLPDSDSSRRVFSEAAYRLFEEKGKNVYVLCPKGNQYFMAVRAEQDADKIAKLFGGGGRARAAGTRSELDLETITEKLEKEGYL